MHSAALMILASTLFSSLDGSLEDHAGISLAEEGRKIASLCSTLAPGCCRAGDGFGLSVRAVGGSGAWKTLCDLFLLFSSLPTSPSASPLLHLVTNISVNQALSSAANVVYRMEVLV